MSANWITLAVQNRNASPDSRDTTAVGVSPVDGCVRSSTIVTRNGIRKTSSRTPLAQSPDIRV